MQILETANNILGPEPTKERREWFDKECKATIEDRNKAHQEYLARPTRQKQDIYKEKRRETDKLCRRKKRAALNSYLLQMDDDFKKNNTSDTFKCVKRFKEGFKAITIFCMDSEENLLSKPEEVKSRRVEYFNALLNTTEEEDGEVERVEKNLNPLENETDEEKLIPDEAGVDMAILRQGNNKAPEIDGIPVELLKANETIRKEIYKLIVKIWRTEQIPTDWKYSIVCPVYKNKGDKLCQNYRGISLLCTGYKAFTTVLKNKVETYAEQLIGAYKAGFREGKSTIDKLFTVKLILEKFWEYKIDVHQIFVDFKQAYDKINREKLYKIMLYFGIPEKLIRLRKVTMEDSAFYINIQTELTEPTTRNGLKQGDGLAPLVFNIVLEYVIRKSNINTDGTLIYKSIQIAAYADDVNIMA
jgi:hypothetical protein